MILKSHKPNEPLPNDLFIPRKDLEALLMQNKVRINSLSKEEGFPLIGGISVFKNSYGTPILGYMCGEDSEPVEHNFYIAKYLKP